MQTRQDLTDAIADLPPGARLVLRLTTALPPGDYEVQACPTDATSPSGERVLNGVLVVTPGAAVVG